MMPDAPLDEEARRFELRPLAQPLFLNSVPKSGTHLLRNIMRMFIPVESQYRREAIQIANIAANVGAFSPHDNLMSWGHLLFSDTSAVAVRPARHLVLVRDPHSWVLASARFFLSDQYRGPLDTIKKGAVALEDVYNLMIFGAFDKNPNLQEIFTYNAIAWMAARAHIVRYEDILAHARAVDSTAAEAFFSDLLNKAGIEKLPADWRTRISIGADRRFSGTARESLTGGMDVPDVLPDAQKRLIEFAAPGVRRILGYE
jgi:hypothetical protein